MIKDRSWYAEFCRKYNKILQTGMVEDLDEANIVVLEAIEELDKIKRRREGIEIKRNPFL